MVENEPDDRVLIAAPVGQDAPVMASLLAEHGIKTAVCADEIALCTMASNGAGAILLTEEALDLPRIGELFALLKKQPPWSELPLIILTSGGDARLVTLVNLAATAAGGITLLERPIDAAILLCSVEVALRSRRRQYQIRDLLGAKARLATIVESSDDAIISKDLQGIIMTWNHGAERLFGYKADEVIGKSITILIPPDRLNEETAILSGIKKGKPVEHYETVRRRKDGSLLDISLTISPIIDANGKIQGASKIARNITARKQSEKALAQAQEELHRRARDLETAVAERTADLRETNEHLDAFVYSIAHDLRSPLRSIISFSQLLEEESLEALNDNGRQYLKRILGASEFMDKLLLDLLAYGRTARAQLELAPVNLSNAWKMAAFQCAGQIEQSHAKIEVTGGWPTVLAHEATLSQCLANLLSNAIKFVAPGVQPHIQCKTEVHRGRVRFSIQDNGIGIPGEQHERIFRVFERLNGSQYAGTGIGLSIVRKGIERMGGTINLESKVGHGSKFWFELARAPRQSATLAPQEIMVNGA